MRELKADEIVIGQHILFQSDLMPYQDAKYNGIVKEIYPRFVVLEVTIIQDTIIKDIPWGTPNVYNVAILKTEFNSKDKNKHFYAVA